MNIAFARLRTAALAGAFVLAGTLAAQAEVVFHRGNGAEPETLDPHKLTGITEANITYDLFEGLVTMDPHGQETPGAAESWTVSDDGLVYTFNLRKDGKWSNGEPVTADDVVYSFRRLVDPATAADYGYILAPVTNADQINSGELKDVTQLGVEAVDQYTVKVTLKASTPYFTGILAHSSCQIVNKAAIDKFGDTWTRPGNSVSNGAYTVAEWVPQSKLVLKKNPNFHDAANVKIDTVVYYPTEDLDEEYKRFQAGELDFTYDVPSERIKAAAAEMPKEFHNAPYFGTYFYGINMTKEPLSTNLALRKALMLAVNREVLTDKITQGGEQPAYAWVPPGVPGYEQQKIEGADMTQEERNELAKKYYAEAGYSESNPYKVEILYNTSENHKKIAVAIASMWKQTLGVDATLKNEEWKVYLDTREQKQYQLARMAWIGDYLDPSNFMEQHTQYAGTQNDLGYNNATFDGDLRKAQVTPENGERMKILEAAEKTFLTDVPIIPIYHYTNQHLVSTKITGYYDNLLGWNLTRYMAKAE